MPSAILKNIEDPAKCGHSAKDIEDLWKKIRRRRKWKERFGTSAGSVIRASE